jgi:DNA or RNA helicases of superfamily II
MAVRLKLSELSLKQKKTIRKILIFQPKTNETYGCSSKTIIFYALEKGDVLLPYKLASGLTQRFVNQREFSSFPFDMTVVLREHQVPVFEEAFQQLEMHGTTTIQLRTGFGKTFIGAALAARLGLRTLVVVYREIIAKQWCKTFDDMSTANFWFVGYNDKDVDITKTQVIIALDQRISKIPKGIRKEIGTFIIDECETMCTANRCQQLLLLEPKYIIALSATPFRDDGADIILHTLCGTHKVVRSVCKTFKVIKVTTKVQVEHKKNARGTVDWTHLINSILYNESRNMLILHLVREFKDRKILIITSQVKHAKLLYEKISEFESVDLLAGKKSSYEDSRILVGTISKCGTGFDEATACTSYSGRPIDLLLLCCSIKKLTLLEQVVGRAFRSEEPLILHIVDDDSIIRNHWYICRKWYLSHGAEIDDYK